MTKKAPWTTMPQYAKPATVKARKYIRSRTPARQKQERLYKLESTLWLAGKTCSLCPSNPSKEVECHHIYGRKGKLLLMSQYWAALCPVCHQYVHDHPEWARSVGMLAPVGQFNSVPK